MIPKLGHHFLVDHQVNSILTKFGVNVFVVDVNVVVIVVHTHQSIIVDQVVDLLIVYVVDGVDNVPLNRFSPVADNFLAQDWPELFNVLQRRWKCVCGVER